MKTCPVSFIIFGFLYERTCIDKQDYKFVGFSYLRNMTFEHSFSHIQLVLPLDLTEPEWLSAIFA
jgi:hypothetical protein